MLSTPKRKTEKQHFTETTATWRSRSRTPEILTLLSYLQPVTSLSEHSVNTLETLLKIVVDFRKATSQTPRIQRGSPNAHALGNTISNFRPRIVNISADIKQVFAENEHFPGMYLLRAQFLAFQERFNENFNDGGNEAGYSERVRLLEKLMYLNGTLRGHIEMILEQHSYWKAKLAGQAPPKTVRRSLDFNQEADIPQVQATGVHSNLPPPQPGGFVFCQAAYQPQAVVPLAQLGVVSPSGLVPGSLRQSSQQTDTPPKANPELNSDSESATVKLNLCEHLQSSVTCLWESKNHTDITFLVSGENVSAHRVILASQSEYFDRLLYGEMKESHQDEIELQDVSSPQAFKLLIEYSYTGRLTIENGILQDVLDVLELCDRFGFVIAKVALSEQLATKVTMSNVLQLLVFADLYEARSLVDKCFKIIDDNATEVLALESLLSLPGHNLKSILSRDTLCVPEIAVFNAVHRWSVHNKSNGDFTEVLSCVRLSEILPEDLFNRVESTHLFKQEDLMNALRIQIKPDLEQTNPRGQKSIGRNLFQSATPASRNQRVFIYPKNRLLRSQPPSIVDGVVQLEPSQSTVSTGLGAATNQQSIVTVMFGEVHLVNRLEFCGFPQSNKYSKTSEVHLKHIPVLHPAQLPGSQPEAFSYVVRVSQDQKKWLTLFDYTDYSCLGSQALKFPAQAVKYVQFELKKCRTQGFELKFNFCMFSVEEARLHFKFRGKGVIAPQYPYKPLAHQCELTADHVAGTTLPTGKSRLLVIFQQPLSISKLKFKILGPNHTKANIAVLVSAKDDLKLFQEIGTQDDIELGKSFVQLQFEEREVVYMIVVVTNETTTIKRKALTTNVLPVQTSTAATTASTFKVTDNVKVTTPAMASPQATEMNSRKRCIAQNIKGQTQGVQLGGLQLGAQGGGLKLSQTQPLQTCGGGLQTQPTQSFGLGGQLQPTQGSLPFGQTQPAKAFGTSGSVQTQLAQTFGGGVQTQPAQAFCGNVQTQPAKAFGTSGSVQTQQAQTFCGSVQTQPAQTFGGGVQTQPAKAFGTSGSVQTQPAKAFGTSGSVQTQPAKAFGTSGSVQTQPAQTFGGSVQTQPAQTFGGGVQTQPAKAFGTSGSVQTQPAKAFGTSGSVQTQPSQTFGGGVQTQPAKAFGTSGSVQTQPAKAFGTSGSVQTQPAQTFGGGVQTQPAKAFGGGVQTQPAKAFGTSGSVQTQPAQTFGGGVQTQPAQAFSFGGQLQPAQGGSLQLGSIQPAPVETYKITNLTCQLLTSL